MCMDPRNKKGTWNYMFLVEKSDELDIFGGSMVLFLIRQLLFLRNLTSRPDTATGLDNIFFEKL